MKVTKRARRPKNLPPKKPIVGFIGTNGWACAVHGSDAKLDDTRRLIKWLQAYVAWMEQR